MSKKDLVIDCSITLAWYLADEKSAFTDAILDKLPNCNAWLPMFWRIEFTNAMMMAYKKNRISKTWLTQSIHNANQRPFKYDEHAVPMNNLLELAEEYNLTTYDATYLELAKRKKASLVTLDRALIKAAKAANIHLIEKA